jgi:uncharacterized protein DUF4350
MIEAPTPFLERAHKVVLAVGAASLLFGLIWAVAVDEGDFITSCGPNGYSRSSIGFRAFGELLEKNGVEVVHSRFRSADRTRPDDLLVVAAPDPETTHDAKDDALNRALAKAQRLLLVLPKWGPGKGVDTSEAEVAHVVPVEPEKVGKIAALVAPGAELVRVAAPTFALNAFGATPELEHAQLLRDASITPLLSGDDGLLIGSVRVDGRQQMVLSDPDVVSNWNLAQGENAALALALVDALRGEGGRVVFDETPHGFERAPSIWRELGRAPLKQGSAHLLLLALAALAAGIVRFGRPRPLRAGWREGKQALLDNTAELMELVGHAPSAVARYFDATIERLAEALHLPAALDRGGRTQWLESRLAPDQRRELAELARAVAPAEGGAAAVSRRSQRTALRELAARIHRFREEVLHGAR